MHLTAAPPRLSGAWAEAGFSMHELMVASLLMGVVVAAFGVFGRHQLFQLRDQADQLELQSAARGSLDLFSTEVRRACGIANASNLEIEIQADLDGNGALGGTNEDVTYRIDSDTGELLRTANGVTNVVTEGVDIASSSIRYFDFDGNELLPGEGLTALDATQRDSVQKVRLEVELVSDAFDPHNDMLLRAGVATTVNLRNRFFVRDVTNPACAGGGGGGGG